MPRALQWHCSTCMSSCTALVWRILQDSSQHVEASAHRNLVVAVDASKTAEKLVKWTLEHVARPGDKVLVLHVMPSEEKSSEGIKAYADALLGFQPRLSPTEVQRRQQSKHEALQQFVHTLEPADGSPPPWSPPLQAAFDSTLHAQVGLGMQPWQYCSCSSSSAHCILSSV